MRVDDGTHRNKTVKCKGDMNFDAGMTVGWDKDKTKDNGNQYDKLINCLMFYSLGNKNISVTQLQL